MLSSREFDQEALVIELEKRKATMSKNKYKKQVTKVVKDPGVVKVHYLLHTEIL